VKRRDRLARQAVHHDAQPLFLDRPELRRRRVDDFLGHLERADLVLPHGPPALLSPQPKHERVARRRNLGDIELERLGAGGGAGGLGGRGRREWQASEQQETGPAHWSRESPSDRKSTRLNSSHVAISYAVF